MKYFENTLDTRDFWGVGAFCLDRVTARRLNPLALEVATGHVLTCIITYGYLDIIEIIEIIECFDLHDIPCKAAG